MAVKPDPALIDGLTRWRSLPALQQPNYPDPQALKNVTERIRINPPLVFAGEADSLKQLMAQAGRGEAFALQGGDCAETFAESTADHLRRKIQTILQMAIVLTYGGNMPVVKMGRMAGQYAKPRSADTETIDGVTLPSYRGDAVNGHEFTAEARTPDPERLMEMYNRSATSLNLIRAFAGGGFADLRQVQAWNRGFAANPAYKRYERLAGDIDKALGFMRAAGVDFDAIRTVDFYSAHEALLLEYENAMVRIDSRNGLAYSCSAHLLWIGERTRQIGGAHMELLSHVQNPLGVKLGPTTSVEDVLRIMDKLNPAGEEGRLSLITRMGTQSVREFLPVLIEAVKADGRPVTWICDPMHGNTFSSTSGYKTRRFSEIIDEVKSFFEIHRALGTHAGGIHVELTGDDVTEVLGGSETIVDETLKERYESLVDPRLNHQQALEMAFLVADMLAQGTK